ncbi:MAG: TetR/AcrR family transcriptional regulator [Pseudomonadota bacterium]
MPYTKEHKLISRERILRSAIALFSRRGYDNVTLDQVMAHAGMTRGAFYNHFSSKQQLYAEAMITGAKISPISGEIPKGCDAQDHLMELVKGYLSMAHVKDIDTPCLMAFMVTDVANNEPEVRRTYTQIFKRVSRRVASLMDQDDELLSQKSQALVALLIGGVAVCRAFNDEKLACEVLAACQNLAAEVVISK